MNIKMSLSLLVSIVALSGVSRGQSNYYLHDGDIVVFYGDSITEQEFYINFIETFTVTRFPSMKVWFINSGWGGDTVSGGAGGPIDLRLSRDVVPYNPTVFTCMLGMNDGAFQPYSDSWFQNYSAGYQHIVDSLTSQLPDLRISLFQPSPFDEITRPTTVPGGYNSVLIRYGAFVANLASSESALTADLNPPVVALLQAALAADPSTAQSLYFDQIHPAAGASLIMAETVLKAWNAPNFVFRAQIDANAGTVARSDNTAITNLQVKQGGLTWTQLDGSLPMPVDQTDPTEVIALLHSDFLSALNQQALQVTGLPAGSYQLSIDGALIGTFTQAQLATGIDLAGLPTPMAAQAAQVHILTWTHNQLHYNGWRGVQIPLSFYQSQFSGYQSALNGLNILEQQIVASQRNTAQPQPHKFALQPD